MRHLKIERWSLGILRCVAATALALLMAHSAPSARARGTGAAGGAGANSVQITISFPQLAVTGGDYEIANVILSQPAPQGGAKVTVTSDTKDVKIAPMTPASITVPANSTSVSFKAITSAVGKQEIATITATYKSATTSVKLTLQPNGVASVSMQPASVNWGSSASGGVQLKSPAPQDIPYYKNMAPKGAPAVYMKQVRTGGATVTLKSSGSVTVPASVKIPSGTSFAKFTATAPQPSPCSMAPGSPATATITATWETPASGTLKVGQNNGKPSRYTSNAIRIDPYTIVGVSHDAQVVVLEGSDCANSLTAGSVMFIQKLGVLKVGAVKKVPIDVTLLSHKQLGMLRHNKATGKPEDAVAVGVSSASLTDFINDGTLQILKETPQTASEPGGSGGPFADAAEPYSQQPPGQTPWKLSVNGTSVSYSFTAFKQNNGLSASVSAKGQVDTNGGYNFLAVIHSGKLQQATYTVSANGTLDVNWLVQTTAAGQGIGESRLRMPPLYSGLVDDRADDVPFLFQIYANLIFKPGFGEKAAAQGHFKVTYSGEGGIDGAQPTNQGLDAKAEIDSTTSSAKAAHGVVAAINAPKFAMTFSKDSFLWAMANRLPDPLNTKNADFADGLEGQLSAAYASKHTVNIKYPQPDDYFKVPRAAYVQWVSSVAYAGSGLMGVGLMSSVPCQQYYQTYLVQAGMDKDMLGSISGSIPPDKGVEVFKGGKVTLIPAIKGCEPKK